MTCDTLLLAALENKVSINSLKILSKSSTTKNEDKHFSSWEFTPKIHPGFFLYLLPHVLFSLSLVPHWNNLQGAFFLKFYSALFVSISVSCKDLNIVLPPNRVKTLILFCSTEALKRLKSNRRRFLVNFVGILSM